MKEHVQEIELKYRIGEKKSDALVSVLETLGFSFKFELEMLVPFDVKDPKVKAAVKALAKKILKAACKGAKDLPTTCELRSYRKVALAYQAQQQQTKVKIKPPQAKQRVKKCMAKK